MCAQLNLIHISLFTGVYFHVKPILLVIQLTQKQGIDVLLFCSRLACGYAGGPLGKI